LKTIYLHGFASGPGSRKARFFKSQLEEAGIEVLVPDLAEGDFENLTVRRQLQVTEELVGDNRVRLIGSSMGGYLAALFASLHESKVEKMVLLAPAFGFAARWPAVVGAEAMEQWMRTGKLSVFHYGEQRMRELGLAMYRDSQTWDPEPEFTQPALLFHGVMDTVVPIEASRKVAEGRRNVRLVEMDSDHELIDVLPAIWEQSREFLVQS
jgi:pimeloyl-ACP methyl ester carboxylesterase